MSVWTHVSGMIRIDGFMPSEETVRAIQQYIGNPEGEVEFESTITRPTGSDGSFECFVIPAEENSICFVTLVFIGDLRDYEELSSIRRWFNSLMAGIGDHEYGIDGVAVRQAAFSAYCETGISINFVGYGREGSWVYLDENWQE